MSKILKHKILSNLVDETEQRKVSMAMFEEDDKFGNIERSQHNQIPPASIRIQSVKTRNLTKLPAAIEMVNRRESELIAKKNARLMEDNTYQSGLAFANLGSQYDVSTNASTAGGLPSASQRPLSQFQVNEQFEKTEKAIKKKPYDTFWTANMSTEPIQHVKYQQQNRFEGRSSYFSYYPTDQLFEQKLESNVWQHQNRKLQEKRTQEESKQLMYQWGQARTRIEAEIQRRKEHKNTATNFEKARGFVRTDWRSKNFDPNSDPTVQDSSTDMSELAEREREENKDEVDDLDTYSSPKKQSTIVKDIKPKSVDHAVDLSDSETNPSSKPDNNMQLAQLKAI